MASQHPLIRLEASRWSERDAFSPRKRHIEPIVVPVKDRQRHGNACLQQAQQIKNTYQAQAQTWADREAEICAKGIVIVFESEPGVPLQTDGWSQQKNPKFVLLCVTEAPTPDGKKIYKQRWFIRDGALNDFVKVFEEYLNKATATGVPKRRPLVDSIHQIRVAVLEELWTDLTPVPPGDEDTWYEVWLRAGDNAEERAGILAQFQHEAVRCGLTVGKGIEKLPEHTILHVKGRFELLGQSFVLMNCMAEIRRVGNYADFFDELTPEEQFEWSEELLGRVKPTGDGKLGICVLDSGVNRGHPLLLPLLAASDNHTIDADWTTADDWQHGTPMSGLAAYGNLAEVLAAKGTVEIPYILEGVKVVPPPAIVNQDEKTAAAYTAQGVSTVEMSRANRTRVWCMATTMDELNNGRPSSWSSMLDQLASGVDADGPVRRLFCISAGNVRADEWGLYPASNHGSPVQNPGQAWNALCVGSFTRFDKLHNLSDRKGWSPISLHGGMSPNNRTSLEWDKEWPIKPDVVFEGGNAARGPSDGIQVFPEQQLLATRADFSKSIFELFDGTSAATALASQMVAWLWVNYPGAWAETIRGLMVHSARWTPAMESSIPRFDNNGELLTGKGRIRWLLETVGYGVPDFNSAVHCSNNHVTMVAESELQPFKADASYNEYHIYSLPWPNTVLRAISRHQNVRMRVTLSYFIEPNPGSRTASRYGYPGCRLKFKVSSPGQSLGDLKATINQIAATEAAEEEREVVSGSSSKWWLGSTIFRGSLHSDIWEGSAADLLSMKHIAIYPTTGWWKTRLGLKKTESKIRYSLLVTLYTDDVNIDLYTEIVNQIHIPIEVTT